MSLHLSRASEVLLLQQKQKHWPECNGICSTKYKGICWGWSISMAVIHSRYFQYVNLVRCEILMLALVIILSTLNLKKNVSNNSWGCFVMFNYEFIYWFYYRLCLKKSDMLVSTMTQKSPKPFKSWPICPYLHDSLGFCRSFLILVMLNQLACELLKAGTTSFPSQ